ncbi:hypothetical protein EU94_1115 [Prochlorococcus marinus str. MIT 9123]|nr:hypothetical protein [Prochlorococcus marinus]KGF93920.1 hypothetical protein EU94_1115 [Prochlorococcus marinus str. MIT 9123]
MKQITANIKVIATQYEGEEELDIDAICLPLEEQGWSIQSAFIEEEN